MFGADLTSLVDDECPVPLVIENLMTNIELRGLFIEGIYRKSGTIVQIKQIRRRIELAPDLERLSFEAVNVHVMAALVKMFFREMPEPLFTFDLYENFLNVSG